MTLALIRNINNLNKNCIKIKTILINLRSITSNNCLLKEIKLKDSVNNDEDLDKPIIFSKTEAAKWRAQVTRKGAEDTSPWYQPYVITLSLVTFLLYFCLIREESDLDLEFNKNLYDRIRGLEERNLEIALKYNKENNLPTMEIEQRLHELRQH